MLVMRAEVGICSPFHSFRQPLPSQRSWCASAISAPSRITSRRSGRSKLPRSRFPSSDSNGSPPTSTCVDSTDVTDGANVMAYLCQRPATARPSRSVARDEGALGPADGRRSSRTLAHLRSEGNDFARALSDRPRTPIAIRSQPQNLVATLGATRRDLVPVQS